MGDVRGSVLTDKSSCTVLSYDLTYEKIPAKLWRKERKLNESGMKKGSNPALKQASVLLHILIHKHTLDVEAHACTVSLIYI